MICAKSCCCCCEMILVQLCHPSFDSGPTPTLRNPTDWSSWLDMEMKRSGSPVVLSSRDPFHVPDARSTSALRAPQHRGPRKGSASGASCEQRTFCGEFVAKGLATFLSTERDRDVWISQRVSFGVKSTLEVGHELPNHQGTVYMQCSISRFQATLVEEVSATSLSTRRWIMEPDRPPISATWHLS